MIEPTRPSPTPAARLLPTPGQQRGPLSTGRIYVPALASPGGPSAVDAPPRLTVRIATDANARESLAVTLSKPLLALAPSLRAEAPVDLVPPRFPGGVWHLDCRATANARLPARPGSVARFTSTYAVKRNLFGVPHPGSGIAEVALVLAFDLGAEIQPGYYVLRRAG